MPAVHGGLTDKQLEMFREKMIDGGRFEDQSEAVQYAIVYTLSSKYNVEV